MYIRITDKKNVVQTFTYADELTINGRMITSEEIAREEIDRILSVRNDGAKIWHHCPLFIRTGTTMVAMDARDVVGYEIVAEI